MDVLVCIKRVPLSGGKFTITDSGRDIETAKLGFTISPHEEVAVEEAVRIVEAHGGSVTVLTLGPAEAEEQLREQMAIGADRGILIETDGQEWDPQATAQAITDAINADEHNFDLVLMGNESADASGYQVGVRVAHKPSDARSSPASKPSRSKTARSPATGRRTQEKRCTRYRFPLS